MDLCFNKPIRKKQNTFHNAELGLGCTYVLISPFVKNKSVTCTDFN